MPGPLDAVEVWNGPWDNPRVRNKISLQMWYTWLSAGVPADRLLKYHTGMAIPNLVRQVEAVNDPHLDLTLDFGHLFLAANYCHRVIVLELQDGLYERIIEMRLRFSALCLFPAMMV